MTDLTRERLAELRGIVNEIDHPFKWYDAHDLTRTRAMPIEDARLIAAMEPRTVLSLISQCEAGLPASGGVKPGPAGPPYPPTGIPALDRILTEPIPAGDEGRDAPGTASQNSTDRVVNISAALGKDGPATPASGGVSGEDGELIARTREIIADAPLDFPDDAPELQLIRNAETLCARLSALLAERDGLREKVAQLTRAETEYDDILKGLPKLYAERVSASNAALADALGLLRETVGTADDLNEDDTEVGLAWMPGWLDRRDALLAKHGKTEEAKT